MRRHRPALIAAVTALGIGLVALTLVPGEPRVAEADENIATVASIASANPDLLRRLDFEVSPPPVAKPEPVKVAVVQPTAITPAAASLATPAAAVTPPVSSNLSSVGPRAVNMRSGPSTSAGSISVLQPGEAVQVGQASGGWVQVTLSDGTTGWVYGSYLSTGAAANTAPDPTTASDDPAPRPVANIAKVRAVIHGDASDLEDRTARIASHLSAFSRPLDSAPSIFTLQPGDRVHIAEVRGSWIRVETDDGMSGWIRRAN